MGPVAQAQVAQVAQVAQAMGALIDPETDQNFNAELIA